MKHIKLFSLFYVSIKTLLFPVLMFPLAFSAGIVENVQKIYAIVQTPQILHCFVKFAFSLLQQDASRTTLLQMFTLPVFMLS